MTDSHSPSSRRSKVTRRGFLTSAGAGAALAVGTPLLGRMPSAAAQSSLVSRQMPSAWDVETDVIVVGTGGAAFAAAVTAAQAGAQVVIVEKATSAGGTTIYSGNGYWIPNNSKLRALGKEDPKEDALKLMSRLAYPQMYDPESPTLGLLQRNFDLISTFYDEAAPAIDAFESWGALYSMIQPGMGYGGEPFSEGDPEYHAEFPENKVPKSRLLMPDAEKGGARSIPEQMQKYTDGKGVPVLLSHRVVGVFQNSGGAVVGIAAETEGKQVAIRARRGVVFGSGGFTQDATKSLNYLRGPIFAGCGTPTNTGDFIDIGIALGTELGNMNQAWWLQCPLELAVQSPALPGADIWIPWGDSMVMVNKYGHRVVSEKKSYNERSQVHHIYDGSRSEYPNLVLFMIYDDAVAQDPTEFAFRWPVPKPGEDADYVIKGETWQELAANISARLDAIRGGGSLSARVGPEVKLADNFVDELGATIARFNGFAETGEDIDFVRGSTPIQVAWGSGTSRFSELKNPCMAPFRSEGPYYCILVGGMTLDTKGGPVIDTGSRVMHVSGQPVPGLYGAGNCVASPAGQAYWSGGGTLGPALTFGHIAGRNAAAEPEKQLD